MDPKPKNTMVIEARGNAWLIIVIRYILDGAGGWKPVEEIIRGPVGYPDGEDKFKAMGYAEQQKIKRGIFGPVEVRENGFIPEVKPPEEGTGNPEAKCSGCGKLFYSADDYDTLGSISGLICPDCGSEAFEAVEVRE